MEAHPDLLGSITTLVGSILFTIGSFFWLFDDSFTDDASLALVTYPFLAGGILFSVSCYIAYYECINDQQPSDKQLWFTTDPKIALKPGPLGCFSFFIGTLVFGITCFAGPFHATSADRENEELLDYGPSAVGCIFFCIGSFIECKHNKVLVAWRSGVNTIVWWVCTCNAAGSVLFTAAAFCGLDFFQLSNTETSNLIVWPYTLGSFLFAIGSALQVAMWKRNLFGAGWMREVMEKQWADNELQKPLIKPETTWLMVLAIFTYATGCSLAVVEVAFTGLTSDSYSEISTSLFGILVTLGVLSLGAVLHSHPPSNEYHHLFYLLHFCMMLYVSAKIAQVYHLSKCCSLQQSICLCDGLVYNTNNT